MDQAEKLRAEHPVEPDESPPTSGQSEQECSQELLRDDRGRAEHPVKPEKWIREGSDQAEKVGDGTGQTEHPVQPGTLTPPTSSRAEQICSQEMSRNDPYVKAWLDWKERYEKEGMEKTKRLEKQERLE